ncbi:MAG TPA: hypothetical protein PLU72_16285 [Candidatus Ozemobacteraceae bacterium]|nr:hypothetical protein [Candidatus Ozemobacteraceae bacterium]HQG27312.1 hypothetical protein [Candidatus Ozemobacteraceae bacterium]
MFENGNVRVTRRDGFRWALAVIFVLQIIIAYLLVDVIQDQLKASKAFKAASETDQPREGEYVCLTGKVIPHDLKSDDPAFEQAFRKVLRLGETLMFEATFTHSEKRGKNTHTITDRIIRGSRRYTVDTPAGVVRLAGSPDRLYSHHSARFDVFPAFESFSPRSRTLRTTYFAPTRLHLIGVASHESNGEVLLSGKPGKPLIVSEVPRDQLLSNTRLAAMLAGAAIVYFLTTLFIPWKRSLREQIERMPSVCYIFDMTGGPEGIALLLFVLYAVGAIVVLNVFGGDHQFRVDQLKAVLFLGFCMLVHVGRSVEYFYVADKRDGFLYEYSRGLFSLSRTRLAPFADLRLWIDIQRGSKGSKSYYLKASPPKGKGFDLGGTGSSEATLLEIKREFEAFRKNRPEPQRSGLLTRDV